MMAASCSPLFHRVCACAKVSRVACCWRSAVLLSGLVLVVAGLVVVVGGGVLGGVVVRRAAVVLLLLTLVAAFSVVCTLGLNAKLFAAVACAAMPGVGLGFGFGGAVWGGVLAATVCVFGGVV